MTVYSSRFRTERVGSCGIGQSPAKTAATAKVQAKGPHNGPVSLFPTGFRCRLVAGVGFEPTTFGL